MTNNTPTPFKIDSIEDVTNEVRVLSLRALGNTPYAWRAGQYVCLGLGDFDSRHYSIANPPGDGALEVHVRRSGAGGLSDHICTQLNIGDTLHVEGPFGAAYFRAQHGGPLLAIAGGTGLAPMKAVVEAALQSDLNRDVHLYVGVQTERDLYLERYFIKLTHAHSNFRFITVIAEPTKNSGRRSGLVGDAVAADFPFLYGHQCYLAGPPAMVAACRSMLKLKSVPAHDIFSDIA